MEHPIITAAHYEGDRIFYDYHQYSVCAKTNELAQECFKYSDCEGECLNYVGSVDGDEKDVGHKSCSKELYVLNTVIILN